jgi:hypothetical protein
MSAGLLVRAFQSRALHGDARHYTDARMLIPYY